MEWEGLDHNVTVNFSYTTAPDNGTWMAEFISLSTSVPGAEYVWDFGDGKTGVDANASNRYFLPGKYAVTLYVITPNGTGKHSKTIEIA